MQGFPDNNCMKKLTARAVVRGVYTQTQQPKAMNTI